MNPSRHCSRTPWTVDQPIKNHVPTRNSTTQHNTCLKWDSNPLSQSSHGSSPHDHWGHIST